MGKSLLVLITITTSTIFVVNIGFHVPTAEAQIYDSWSSASAASMLAYPSGRVGDYDQFDLTNDDLEDGDDTEGAGMLRRSLYWKRVYYISYGAMSANRVPCPPRSGRSYYTHNCFHARGPVHPYSRSCSCIARCRR